MTQTPDRLEKPLELPSAPCNPARPASERPPRRLASGKFVTTHVLSDRTCKWPIGDPAEPGFHYCGHPPELGRPYCDVHDKRSYQPMRKRAL
jgi:GcrA cell cycle regulator